MKLFFLSGLLLSCAVLPAQEENLFFAHAASSGAPLDRAIPSGAKIERKGNLLNIAYSAPGGMEYKVYITPDLGDRLLLTGRLQTENLVSGREGWQNARIAMRFLDRAGKQTGGWPEVVAERGNRNHVFTKIYEIPSQAHILLIEPAHFGKSGRAVYTDLKLSVPPENLLLAPNPGGVSEKGIRNGVFSAGVRDGKVFFRIDGSGDRKFYLPLSPKWKSLKLSMKMKTTDVRKGNADWKDARLALRFYGKKGPVGPWPNNFTMTGTNDWRECSRVYPIPKGAVSLEFAPSNFGDSGTLEFKDVVLVPDGKN